MHYVHKGARPFQLIPVEQETPEGPGESVLLKDSKSVCVEECACVRLAAD